MSKSKATKVNNEYLCFVYGDGLASKYIRFFTTDTDPEPKFEEFKTHYGPNVKGRYVKIAGSASELYTKVRQELTTVNATNPSGDLFEYGVAKTVKIMRDAAGVKGAHTWNVKSEEAEDTEQAASAPSAAQPASSAQAQPASGAQAQPESAAQAQPASGAQAQPAPQAEAEKTKKPRGGKKAAEATATEAAAPGGPAAEPVKAVEPVAQAEAKPAEEKVKKPRGKKAAETTN